jgi:hypothetical protein
MNNIYRKFNLIPNQYIIKTLYRNVYQKKLSYIIKEYGPIQNQINYSFIDENLSIIGYFISKKNGGKEMHYRSGYECEVYACLEKIPEVIKYDVEPFPIKYLYNGKQHEYNPDLSIIYDDDRVEIWEIKPANQTALPLNEAKWAACQCYCESRGWSFIVVTEVGIGKLKKRTSEINPL